MPGKIIYFNLCLAVSISSKETMLKGQHAHRMLQ